jgi:hypothetical protein
MIQPQGGHAMCRMKVEHVGLTTYRRHKLPSHIQATLSRSHTTKDKLLMPDLCHHTIDWPAAESSRVNPDPDPNVDHL